MEAVVAVGAGGGEGRSSNKRGRVKAAAGDTGAEPDTKRRNVAPGAGAAAALAPWAAPQQQHPASRIYRVSRASGGKDRHSKVYTAKGIRDRRVRLSVATAIQFYDLQDRLGYDQPSKAIEWLIKAAAAAIDKLPSLDAAAGFPAHPASAMAKDHQQQQQHHHHHTPPDADADADADAPPDADHHQQLTRSGCSSTSETSKGSVLSLSRSESRVKARERARERSAAASARGDKDKDPAADDAATTKGRPATSSAQAASFTELLTGMAAAAGSANADHKQQQQQQSSAPWQAMAAPATADYIGFAQPRKAAGHAMAHSFASPAPHLANIAPIAMSPAQHFGLASGAVTVASGGGEPHAEMTQFSFLQDHFMPVHTAPASAPAGDYNLNFSMSSGLVGVNSRGTLQSNSQPHISGHHHHHHHHQQLQRLSTSLDAPNIPSFLFSPAAAVTSPPTAESQFAAFQLWNGFQHADMKEKGKN